MPHFQLKKKRKIEKLGKRERDAGNYFRISLRTQTRFSKLSALNKFLLIVMDKIVINYFMSKIPTIHINFQIITTKIFPKKCLTEVRYRID